MVNFVKYVTGPTKLFLIHCKHNKRKREIGDRYIY